MTDDFSLIKKVLEAINRSGAAALASYEQECARALFENGFVDAMPPNACALTADGRDLLDAMRDSAEWERIERAVAATGPLSLAKIKAVVAERLSGGFNA